MQNRNIQIDNVDRLPQGSGGQHDVAPWVQAKARLDWRATAVLCAFALLALLILYWLFGRDVVAWVRYGEGYTFIWWLLFIGVLYVLLMALRRVVLVEQRGYQVPIWNAHTPQAIDSLIGVDLAYANRKLPNALQVTYSPTEQAALPDFGEDVPEAEIVPELAAVIPLPPNEWLPWFDARPHGLLAAETGGGKSTLFKLIAKSRIERGELLFLLDPHSSDWFGLPAIGGGEDWEAVWCGMQVVINEYQARLQARDEYLRLHNKEKPVSDFTRITVLLDEANTACAKLSVGTKRGERSRWEQFAEALGSGARKVNLSIECLAQSPNVDDLDLSRPMLNNFTRICLDAYTAQILINHSLDTNERKQELRKALQGQEYPAVTTIKGYATLLDRTGLNNIVPPANPERALWRDGYERTYAAIAALRPAQRATQAVSAARIAPSAVHTSVRPKDDMLQNLLNSPLAPQSQTDGRTDGRAKLYLKAMAGAGKSRDYARARMTQLGLTFENKLWTEVRKELGLD